MGVPHLRMVYDGKSHENPNLKWMITRGTPISGKLQIQSKISSVGTDEVGNLFVFRDSCHGQIQLGPGATITFISFHMVTTNN